MYFILPDERNVLPKLEKDFIEHHLSHGQEVKFGSFQLHHFKISFSLEELKVFKKLGLVLPFSNDVDFIEMVDSHVVGNLYISNIFHKLFVEVIEEDTKPTTTTTITFALRSVQMDPLEDFIPNHSFMFVIKEDLIGVVLFIGHVLNPFSD
eukprot:Gb_11464 [translate_table: standard]